MPLSVRTKRTLLAGFAFAAYVVWALGAWDAILIRSGIRPKLRPVLLLAGDSLTEKGTNPKSMGWVTQLQHDYARSADIVPRGLSGYNTRWYLEYSMPIIESEIANGIYTPAFITVWLGANDAALPEGSSSEQHVPIETYKENLKKIVHAFRTMAPDARILLITPPHVDDATRQRRAKRYEGAKRGLVDRTNAVAGEYAAACVETANSLGVSVLDLHTYFNDMPEWRRRNLLEDGLHLNTRGNKLMYEQLQDKIHSEFPDVERKLRLWQAPSFTTLIDSDPWTIDTPPETSAPVNNTAASNTSVNDVDTAVVTAVSLAKASRNLRSTIS
ncbi:hypothetical protein PHYBOEH_002630 [Phytophthora boehmeriae]|uniref:SGNH hydrolase-type esterase domain-containing protein n=1 Tax=Phytophthora boehmeriae TaxID=109152 RepID=A0A8T1WWJ6_9STRA|nr:hypothetical protein PHYBOEH_002630 [Phytophthora boehmeriae]